MKNKFLCIVLALTIVASLVLGIGITASADEQVEEKPFRGTTINLAENITIGFYFDKEAVDALDSPTVKVELPSGRIDESQTVEDAATVSLSDGSLCYVFLAEIAVKEYYEDATVTITGKDGEAIEGTLSVNDYCESYISNYPSGEYAKLITALKAYSDAAIDYFITPADQPLTKTDYDFDSIETVRMDGTLPAGLLHRSATLLLESEMTIRHYFELTGDADISSYKFYNDLDGDEALDDGEELSPNEKGGRYYFDIEGITPNEIDKVYTIAVEKDGEVYTCKYGALTYAASIYKKAGSSNDAKNLVSAIANYNKVASDLRGTVFFSDGDWMEYEYGVNTPIDKVLPQESDTKAFAGWVNGIGVDFPSVPAYQSGNLWLTAKWYLSAYDRDDIEFTGIGSANHSQSISGVKFDDNNFTIEFDAKGEKNGESLVFPSYGIRIITTGDTGNGVFVSFSTSGEVRMGTANSSGGAYLGTLTDEFSHVKISATIAEDGTVSYHGSFNGGDTVTYTATTAKTSIAQLNRIQFRSWQTDDNKLIMDNFRVYSYDDVVEEIPETEATVNFVDGGINAGSMVYNYGDVTPIKKTLSSDSAKKIFAGWKDDNGNYVTEIGEDTRGDITLTASWVNAIYLQSEDGISKLTLGNANIGVATDGSDILSVTVPAGNSKVVLDTGKTLSFTDTITINMTLAKVEGESFPGFGIRLRSSSINPGNFMSVSASGEVNVLGETITELSVDPTTLTIIFKNDPDNASAMLADVYLNGELVCESLGYAPGFGVSSAVRFYQMFNYSSSTEYSGKLCIKDLAIIDGELNPSVIPEGEPDNEEGEMDKPQITDATFSTVLMNVGADESMRNITWYSNYHTDGEIRWAKASDVKGGVFPPEYSSAPAFVNTTTKAGYSSYKATISGLEANTSYVYCLVTGATASELYSFEVKSHSDEYTFVFAGDPQVGTTGAASWSDTLQKVEKNFPETVLIVSAGDQTSTATNEGDYETFIVPELSKLPVAVTLGPGHDNANTYTMHYNQPNLSSTYGVSATTSDYFYKYASTLFMHINVESSNYASHAAFIRNTVKNNPDCIWQVVTIHYSAYSGLNGNLDFRSNLSPVYAECGIDVVLSGHDHIYARSQLMIGNGIVSDDVITDNTVTDPKGVLYVCGLPATNATNVTADKGTSDYTLKQSFEERKSVVVFNMTESSMSMTAYYLDGDTPEAFDTFTIYRTTDTVRLNGETDKLEYTPDGGETRVPLVNAYDYESATIKAIDGFWSISTDGDASFSSLGIAAGEDADKILLKINEQTGYWELSKDAGESFSSLPVNVNIYSITFVTDYDVTEEDISYYPTYDYKAGDAPDTMALPLPAGSIEEGVLYEWSWEYYSKETGALITEFERGGEYIAKLRRDILRVSSSLTVAGSTNAPLGIYSWRDAWDIVARFPETEFTLALSEDLTLASTDAVLTGVPTNVVIDLAGHTLDSTSTSYIICLANGASPSNISFISSLDGGVINALSVFELRTGKDSVVNVAFGGEGSKPITVNGSYIVSANNNFKTRSKLTLDLNEGNYVLSNSLVYVYSYDERYNYYYITASNADISVGNSVIFFKDSFCAQVGSYFNAEATSFSCIGEGTAPFFSADQWLGTVSFSNCEFSGITIDSKYTE